MILFQDDWKRFPGAIVDYKTTNTSFVRLAQLYKSMGVKNHLFHLSLLQPELQGIDPHSPTLTLDQKAMIGTECKYNPWYFFREVVRLPPQAGPTPVVFRANRGNIAVFWSFLNNIDSALIQPRQTGKSASTDCLSDWLIYISATNTRIMLLTKDDSLRRANVERLKGIRSYLPKYLVPMSKDDSDNQFELTCRLHKNSYTTGVAQNSETAANNLGRGLTSPILHCDEGPFINFIGVSLPAALAAGTAARNEAAKYNRPYGNIFTTTAGKKDDRDGRFMYDMIHSAAVWNEIFMDAQNKRDLRQLIMQNCTGRKTMVNITMSHRQLGFTDEWLYDAITTANSTGEAADRDFLNVWTSGTQRSPLSTKLNEVIFQSEMDVLHSEISPERYILRWYLEEDVVESHMSETHVIIGLDTSEAVGRDTIALTMTDVRDLGLLAAGTYNETNLIRFAAYLLQLMVKYPTTVLVIERKSTAQMIVDYLLLKLPKYGIDPFKRIFNKVVNEADENPDAFRDIQRRVEMRSDVFYDQRKSSFGFNTTKDSRALLYGTVLQNAAKNAGHMVRDKTLSSEIRGLVEKNGRIDHAASGHDDMVISWLMAHWFLTHARNLEYYGIPLTSVMSDVSDMGRKLTDIEIMERERQNVFMLEIDQILEKLKKTRDEFIITKLEHRLRYLQTQINDDEVVEDTAGIDMLIHQARDERLKQTRLDNQRRRSDQQFMAYRPGSFGQGRDGPRYGSHVSFNYA